jgi:hypothetical protein
LAPTVAEEVRLTVIFVAVAKRLDETPVALDPGRVGNLVWAITDGRAESGEEHGEQQPRPSDPVISHRG